MVLLASCADREQRPDRSRQADGSRLSRVIPNELRSLHDRAVRAALEVERRDDEIEMCERMAHRRAGPELRAVAAEPLRRECSRLVSGRELRQAPESAPDAARGTALEQHAAVLPRGDQHKALAVAPRSMIAGVYVATSAWGVHCSAQAQSRSRVARLAGSPSMPKQRDSTRLTLPSRMGWRSPRESARIAPAVERPMPGRLATSSKRCGKRPPCSSRIRTAARCRLRARA